MTGVTSGARTARWSLTRDGHTIEIRRLGPRDRAELLRLHAELSEEDRYLRFLTAAAGNPRAYVESITDGAGRVALGAVHRDRLVAVASYAGDGTPVAEFAVVVAHPEQADGVGTLLLEHLVARARAEGISTFTAQVLAANTRMLHVIADLGLPCGYRHDGDVVEVTMALGTEPPDAYQAAVDERDRAADRAALRPLLAPSSVAVVGAGRSADSVGNAVLRNLIAGGFTGGLVAVNPHAREVLGVPSHRSVTDLPHAPELAVLCVPAPAVLGVVRECGQRGVRAVVVISSGLDPGVADRIRAEVRRHDMRMVGPNCLGVLNTDPAVRLDATFADRAGRPGSVGVITQSGGVAIALLHELDRIGCGVATLVSTGDKYDVSGNDLLHWCHGNPRVTAVIGYLESFGDPRKFARLSRALAAVKPIVAIRAGVSSGGSKAAGSHTAALATPAVTADALYRQAGIVAVDSLGEAVSAIALLTSQPLPKGDRVAVVSNAGGAGVLAADACGRDGLRVAELGEHTRHELAGVLPSGAALSGPVDTTATVSGAAFATAITLALADPGVDAVLAVSVPTALGDPGVDPGAAARAAHAEGKPLVLARPGVPVAAQRLEVGPGLTVPSYADVADAVRAVAHAVRRDRWLARDHTVPPDPAGFDRGAVERLIGEYLDGHPDGGWLDPAAALTLLGYAGIPVRQGILVPTTGAAGPVVAAAEELGGPVAVKAVADGVLHKSTSGGIALDQHGPEEITATVARFAAAFGERLRAVFVQPMAAAGAELLAGVHGDARFGPLLVFGVGGVSTDVLGDRAAVLCPASAADIADMVRGSRYTAALFDAHPPRGDERAVVDLLRRLARLAESAPAIAELDINPVIATAHGCLAVDARVLLRPTVPADPAVRGLR